MNVKATHVSEGWSPVRGVLDYGCYWWKDTEVQKKIDISIIKRGKRGVEYDQYVAPKRWQSPTWNHHKPRFLTDDVQTYQ